jgi:hypothetical protein
MDKSLSKIEQLVADARIELMRLGIDTEGKRTDELLNMVREARNPACAARRKPNEPVAPTLTQPPYSN